MAPPNHTQTHFAFVKSKSDCDRITCRITQLRNSLEEGRLPNFVGWVLQSIQPSLSFLPHSTQIARTQPPLAIWACFCHGPQPTSDKLSQSQHTGKEPPFLSPAPRGRLPCGFRICFTSDEEHQRGQTHVQINLQIWICETAI